MKKTTSDILIKMTRSSAVRGNVFVFLLLTLITVSAVAQTYERRERSFDVLHYDIRVRLNEAQRTVRGDVRVTLRGLQSSRPGVVAETAITLDAVDMRINEVSVFAGRGDAGEETVLPVHDRHTWSEGGWTYDSTTLRVQLPGMRENITPDDTVTIRVQYSCRPSKGLFFIQPDVSYPDNPRQIWTQGQAENNRHWFPCYDYPNDKATSEVRMTVDSTLTTISNGLLLSHEAHADGTATWHWSLEQPHSSYLIMLAAGEYRVYEDEADGIPIRSYYYPGDDTADVRRTYDDTGAMLSYFAELIGVPYPWNTYAQIPVARFPHGGMENTTATVMADTRLVVSARAAVDYDPRPLIAHELAHQWAGNLVTYADWSEEWLNEGFATFLQQMWTQERHGFEEMLVQRYEGIRDFLDWTDRAGRLPLVHDADTSPSNTYSKGAAVLHMLQDILGGEEFWHVMRTWMERHAFGNADTRDFQRVIEQVSGRRLDWFFDQWVYGAGYPEIQVTRKRISDHEMELTFRQLQETDSLCGYFRLPITTVVLQPEINDGASTSITLWIDGPQTVDTIPVPATDLEQYMLFDPYRVICGRIHTDASEDDWQALLTKTLKGDEAWHRLITPARKIAYTERFGREQRKDGTRREAEVEAFDDWKVIMALAEHDPHPAVRKAAATRLAELQPQEVEFAVELEELYLRLLDDQASGVRATALNGLHNFRNPALLQVFRRMLADSSFYAEASAMNNILSVDSISSVDIVRSRLRADSPSDVLPLAALDWVRRYRYTALRDVVVNLAGPGHSPALRAKAFETLLILRTDPEVIKSLLLRQLAEPAPEFRLYAVSALRLFGMDEARRILLERLPDEQHPRVRALMRHLYRI